MKTMILAATAMVIGFSVLPARAQDDAQRALAEDLLTAMNMKEVVEQSFQMVKKMIPAQMERMQKAGDKTNGAKKAKQDETMAKLMEIISQELSWDKMKDDYVSLYAETFTKEELEGAIAFYKSPAGQAFAEKQPQLMEQSMKISQKRMMEVMPKIMAASKELSDSEKAPQPKPEKQPSP